MKHAIARSSKSIRHCDEELLPARETWNGRGALLRILHKALITDLMVIQVKP
jgi:hypothetical protein